MKAKMRLWEENFILLLKIVAVLFILLILAYFYFNRRNSQIYKELILQNSQLLENLISEKLEQPQVIQNIFETKKNILLAVISPEGKCLAGSIDLASQFDRLHVNTASKGQLTSYEAYSAKTKENQLFVAVPVVQNDVVKGVLLYTQSMNNLEVQVNRFFLILLIGSLLSILVAFYLIFNFARKINHPIAEMSEIAEYFAQGKFSRKISIPHIIEFETLALSLNKMAEQLDEKIILIDQQKNEINAVLASMGEAVLAVDLSGNILKWNEAFQNLFATTDRTLGKNFSEVIRNKDLEDYIAKCLASNEKTEETTIYFIQQELYMRVNGSAMMDAMGEKYGAVIVLTDITRMKQLEKIRQDFVSNASHEIRTPITSIKGFVETILTNGIDNKEETMHFLNIVEKQSDRLVAIINDLLLLSSLEENKIVPKEEVAIVTVLQEAIQTCSFHAEQKEIKVTLSCAPSISAYIHVALLEQAIVNLLMNAITYSASQSTVEVIGEINNQNLILIVKDKGIGIPAEHLERLFERFYRVDKSRSRKNGGTGLGLSIVKHIAQVHGGTVHVESVSGAGSSFTMTLPLR